MSSQCNSHGRRREKKQWRDHENAKYSTQRSPKSKGLKARAEPRRCAQLSHAEYNTLNWMIYILKYFASFAKIQEWKFNSNFQNGDGFLHLRFHFCKGMPNSPYIFTWFVGILDTLLVYLHGIALQIIITDSNYPGFPTQVVNCKYLGLVSKSTK